MKYMLSFQCGTQEEAQAVLSAVAAIGKQPHACSKQYVEPEEIVKPAAERKNISPGTPSITKIGTNTKEYILNELKASGAPRTIEHFGLKLVEHLKLLWARGEIKFDGTEYYL